MILVEYGPVIIQKDRFNQVSFESVEELDFYAESFTSNVLDGKTYFNYDPVNEIHIDEVLGITEFTGRVYAYDKIINEYDTIFARKSDPLYGLEGEDLAAKQAEIARFEAARQRYEHFRQANTADGIRKITPDQIDSYLNSKYDASMYLTLLSDLQAASTNSEIKSVLISLFQEIGKILNQGKQVDKRIMMALLEVIVSPE